MTRAKTTPAAGRHRHRHRLGVFAPAGVLLGLAVCLTACTQPAALEGANRPPAASVGGGGAAGQGSGVTSGVAAMSPAGRVQDPVLGAYLRRLSHIRSRRQPVPSPTTSPALPLPQESPTTLPAAGPGLVAGRVTVVGDSVTIDAAPALQALIPGVVVDAVVGEQWVTGEATLAALRAQGELGSEVVVALGTNGPVTAEEFGQLMSELEGTSRVVVVTNHVPEPWGETNNALFESELSNYPELRLAQWDNLADQHPGWLYADGTHMPIGGPGAYAWAELVKEQL